MNNKNYLLNGNYSIKAITDLDEFEKLKTEWDNMADKQNAYKPFLCFEWFSIWLKHFLKDNKLLILLLSKEDEIVVIAPFLIKEERFKGINIKKIVLIGNVYSPIRYFLFNELGEEKEKNLSIIFEFFLKIYKKWDMLELYAIPEENNCFEVFKEAIKQNMLKYTDYFCYGDWYLDEIKYTGVEYLNNLPTKIIKDIQYCKRRLQKMGNYEFKLIKNDDLVDYYMDLYYELYSKSWQKKEGIGPIFHRDLAKMAARNGWLRLGFIFFNSSPISSQFWISCNDTAFILKTVYDQDYKNISPGKILTSEMMEYVIDIDKVKVVDYVQGDEFYKQDWTPKRRERKGLYIYRDNFKGKYLAFLSNIVLPALNRHKFLHKAKEQIKKFF